MFGFLKKSKDRQDRVLKEMDGREIKYVTRRVKDEDGNIKENILGKRGRIVVLDGEIRVMCGEIDVFRCNVADSVYYTLLSGDGITVSGTNTLNGEKMDLIVYYNYALEMGSVKSLEKKIASVNQVAEAQKHYYNFVDEEKSIAEEEYQKQKKIYDARQREMGYVDSQIVISKTKNYLCVFAMFLSDTT